MRLIIGLVILCSLAVSAHAFNWKTRSGDARLGKVEVTRLISGKTVKFSRGGWTRYGADGSYHWKGKSNGSVWSVKNDGAVCVDFPSGARRCDIYVRSRVGIVLINAKGKRFIATIK